MTTRASSKGFTLLELMVVVAIIGLLSTVVLASLSTARAKSRNASRLSTIHQLQNALEIYRTEKGSYPVTDTASYPPPFFAMPNCGLIGSHTNSGSDGWIPNLAPTYISGLPDDPLGTSQQHCFAYASNGTDYMVIGYQTVENYSSGAQTGCRKVTNCSEADYAFSTPGAENW